MEGTEEFVKTEKIVKTEELHVYDVDDNEENRVVEFHTTDALNDPDCDNLEFVDVNDYTYNNTDSDSVSIVEDNNLCRHTTSGNLNSENTFEEIYLDDSSSDVIILGDSEPNSENNQKNHLNFKLSNENIFEQPEFKEKEVGLGRINEVFSNLSEEPLEKRQKLEINPSEISGKVTCDSSTDFLKVMGTFSLKVKDDNIYIQKRKPGRPPKYLKQICSDNSKTLLNSLNGVISKEDSRKEQTVLIKPCRPSKLFTGNNNNNTIKVLITENQKLPTEEVRKIMQPKKRGRPWKTSSSNVGPQILDSPSFKDSSYVTDVHQEPKFIKIDKNESQKQKCSLDDCKLINNRDKLLPLRSDFSGLNKKLNKGGKPKLVMKMKKSWKVDHQPKEVIVKEQKNLDSYYQETSMIREHERIEETLKGSDLVERNINIMPDGKRVLSCGTESKVSKYKKRNRKREIEKLLSDRIEEPIWPRGSSYKTTCRWPVYRRQYEKRTMSFWKTRKTWLENFENQNLELIKDNKTITNQEVLQLNKLTNEKSTKNSEKKTRRKYVKKDCLFWKTRKTYQVQKQIHDRVSDSEKISETFNVNECNSSSVTKTNCENFRKLKLAWKTKPHEERKNHDSDSKSINEKYKETEPVDNTLKEFKGKGKMHFLETSRTHQVTENHSSVIDLECYNDLFCERQIKTCQKMLQKKSNSNSEEVSEVKEPPTNSISNCIKDQKIKKHKKCNQLNENGENGKQFILPASDVHNVENNNSVPQKRGPGRPRKNQSNLEVQKRKPAKLKKVSKRRKKRRSRLGDNMFNLENSDLNSKFLGFNETVMNIVDSLSKHSENISDCETNNCTGNIKSNFENMPKPISTCFDYVDEQNVQNVNLPKEKILNLPEPTANCEVLNVEIKCVNDCNKNMLENNVMEKSSPIKRNFVEVMSQLPNVPVPDIWKQDIVQVRSDSSNITSGTNFQIVKNGQNRTRLTKERMIYLEKEHQTFANNNQSQLQIGNLPSSKFTYLTHTDTTEAAFNHFQIVSDPMTFEETQVVTCGTSAYDGNISIQHQVIQEPRNFDIISGDQVTEGTNSYIIPQPVMDTVCSVDPFLYNLKKHSSAVTSCANSLSVSAASIPSQHKEASLSLQLASQTNSSPTLTEMDKELYDKVNICFNESIELQIRDIASLIFKILVNKMCIKNLESSLVTDKTNEHYLYEKISLEKKKTAVIASRFTYLFDTIIKSNPAFETSDMIYILFYKIIQTLVQADQATTFIFIVRFYIQQMLRQNNYFHNNVFEVLRAPENEFKFCYRTIQKRLQYYRQYNQKDIFTEDSISSSVDNLMKTVEESSLVLVEQFLMANDSTKLQQNLSSNKSLTEQKLAGKSFKNSLLTNINLQTSGIVKTPQKLKDFDESTYSHHFSHPVFPSCSNSVVPNINVNISLNN